MMTRKLPAAQGDITYAVTRLPHDTVRLYDSISRGVDAAQVEGSRRQKATFDREARSLQESVLDTVRGAAEKTCESCSYTLVAIEKRLEAVVCQAAGTGELARPEASLSHTSSRGAQADVTRNHPSSKYGLQKDMTPSTMPSSPGAYDPRNYSGYGA